MEDPTMVNSIAAQVENYLLIDPRKLYREIDQELAELHGRGVPPLPQVLLRVED